MKLGKSRGIRVVKRFAGCFRGGFAVFFLFLRRFLLGVELFSPRFFFFLGGGEL